MTTPLLSPRTRATLLDGGFRVRYGTAADVEACQRMTRQRSNRQWLPFVTKPSLLTATSKRELFVAEWYGQSVGFVNWHARRDGINVIYDLCVDERYHGFGIGRNLLYAVPCPVVLKCKADNPANDFYAAAGMYATGTETARSGAALRTWRMDILAQLVQGNNAQWPGVARKSKMAYGTRVAETPQDWPFAVDIEFERFVGLEFRERMRVWDEYMHMVTRWQPVQALALDFMLPEGDMEFDAYNREHRLRLHELNAHIRDLRAAGVLRVLVCPKFDGAVRFIPNDCIVSISVPSSYAGFLPDDYTELAGRKIHLLGGSPVAWFGQGGKSRTRSSTGIIAALHGAGSRVISIDGNGHTGNAESGVYWLDNRWQTDRKEFELYDLSVFSGVQIQKQTQTVANHAQPLLPLPKTGRGAKKQLIAVEPVEKQQKTQKEPTPQQLSLFAA